MQSVVCKALQEQCEVCSMLATAALGTQCSVLCLRCDQRWLIYGHCKSALNDSPTIGCSLAALQCTHKYVVFTALQGSAGPGRAGQYSALCRAALFTAMQWYTLQG